MGTGGWRQVPLHGPFLEACALPPIVCVVRSASPTPLRKMLGLGFTTSTWLELGRVTLLVARMEGFLGRRAFSAKT